jgi:hypothetical protein
MTDKKKLNFGLILTVYLLGIFMGALDTGIVTPARTVIQESLGVNEKTGIWMITIYTLAYASSIPVMGKLADRLGRRTIYLLSIFLFGAGSLFCGLPVRQVSSSENSVGVSSPRRVWVSSRLRWVAGGRSIRLAGAGTLTERRHMGQRLRPCVCSAKLSSAAAGGLGHRQVLRVEALQRWPPSAASQQLALAQRGVELPGSGRARAARRAGAGLDGRGQAVGDRRLRDEQLGWVQRGPASRPGRRRCTRSGAAAPLARPSQARPQRVARSLVHRAQQGVDAVV